MTDFFAFDLPNAWFLSPANIFSIAIRGFKVDLLILMFGDFLLKLESVFGKIICYDKS